MIKGYSKYSDNALTKQAKTKKIKKTLYEVVKVNTIFEYNFLFTVYGNTIVFNKCPRTIFF